VLTDEQRAMQRDIINELNVKADFDAESEIRRRVDFLADHLVETNTRAFVLCIRGGVDSLVAGWLAWLAGDVVR